MPSCTRCICKCLKQGRENTVGLLSSPSYCGPIKTLQSVDPISNVNFAGLNNTTSNVLNASPGHEFFIGDDDPKGYLRQGDTLPIIVKGNVGGKYTDAVTVFIDWNQNGIFEEDETYFTSDTNGGFLTITQDTSGKEIQSTSNTGSIKVPVDAKLSDTRMRVKKAFIGDVFVVPTTIMLEDSGLMSCAVQSYGQIEDYIITVDRILAVSDINKANVSVYPNPFKDVLKISNVKDATSIRVADATGRVVATPKVSQELNLSNLGKGLYFVTVSYENGSTKSFKVIKE